jgi:chorismate mutase/prephenate dehydratase
MAKKKTPLRRSSSGTPTPASSPAELQRRLERSDRELLRALNERAKLVQRLARARGTDGAPLVDLAGEQRHLEQLAQENAGPLTQPALHAIFREVLSASRGLVKPLRVAYLGPKFSYSYLATIERFGESVELSPVATISAVFEELNRGQADFGVVPLEKSTDGRVADTLDMFARLPARICGEVQLRIHHHLLARCPRDHIQEVYSKPQALSQCRDWLARHLPWARTVEMISTAAAAQLAASKAGAAAVASRAAASNYGLDIIADSIEDNKNNVTRFAVIGGEAGPRTGRDKTSLMFEIPHKPGALADVMNAFKRSRLNLTWIESFPIAGGRNEYLFFVELEGHERDAKVKRALDALARKSIRLEVLGSYTRSEPVE